MAAMNRVALFISIAAAGIVGFLVSSATQARDDNAAPRYGDLGLPSNCRALVQENINGYRSKKFTAEEAFGSIERNCGVVGGLWKNMRRD